MTSIRAIGTAAPVSYQPSRFPARALDSTPTPATNPIERVDKLTRQLDESLTNQLARIRARISTEAVDPNEALPVCRRLDIIA